MMKSNLSKLPALQSWRSVLVLGFLILGLATARANGPQREFTRTINREFGITPNGLTALYNQYGKVNVNTWANNSVKIDITIIVNANDQRGADRTFDRINVNFMNMPDYVKAETMIDRGNGWWGPDFGNSCQDFKINYEVWLPAGNSLDLKNKYGNSYVGNLNGKLLAEIKYGDLRAETLGADADLSISYGKGSITKVVNVSGQISYGGLSIGQASNVQIDTKYSELKLDQAGTLRIVSRYDDMSLGDIGELRLQTKYADVRVQSVGSAFVTAQYTDLSLRNLTTQVDVDLTYGDLKIDALGRNFQAVNVIGKYTDTKIYVERGAAFRFEAEGQHTDLSYPAGAKMVRQTEKAGSSSAQGYVGDANARSVVRAKLNYGDFVLR
ncbi:MAG: DUF4097 family beta strand repeat protein [Saprospiraceae bacterium]|nr:DUF4097 family beta strand repeat protein [Saprospiraceae bacterium]